MAQATVNASLTQTLVATAELFGVPREQTLARSELTEAMLADPDARIPFRLHMKVWDVLLALELPFLGLELGKAFHPDVLGVLGFLFSQCATLRDAARVTERYAKLVSELFMPTLTQQQQRAVWEQQVAPSLAKLRHPGEWCLAASYTFVTAVTGKQWPVRHVQFQHPAPPDTQPLREFFGREPQFSQPSSRLELDAEVLDAKAVRADHKLFDYLKRRADQLLAQQRPGDSIDLVVRKHLATQLAVKEPRQDDVARALGMSERTLQRRLKDDGFTFAGLLEEVRKEAALLYLQEPRLAVYEVALMLGYSEPSTFHRAFRRWTGETPQAYRSKAA